MDWRELQEKERIRRTRLLIREEISAVLEDLSDEVMKNRVALGIPADVSYEVARIIDAVQTKIEERGTDGRST
jgi:hypothetical protein